MYPMLKNSGQTIYFPLFASNGSGFLTGASPTVKISKDGGTFATSTNSASEVATASGVYAITLTAGETNCDYLMLRITAASATDEYREFWTTARQLTDLAFPNVSGRGIDVSAGGDVDAAVQSVAAGSIAAAALATDLDVYTAKITLTDDNAGANDRYLIRWFKNGVRVTAGITSPTIQVIKASDGSDLVASTTPTQVASTGAYRYDEGTNRVLDGKAYEAIVTATIDGSTRSFSQPVSRDSA